MGDSFADIRKASRISDHKPAVVKRKRGSAVRRLATGGGVPATGGGLAPTPIGPLPPSPPGNIARANAAAASQIQSAGARATATATLVKSPLPQLKLS